MADTRDPWWVERMEDHIDGLSQNMKITEALRQNIPAKIITPDNWQRIEAQVTDTLKVTTFLDIIRKGEERHFEILAHALWASSQEKAAELIDEKCVYRPKNIIWFAADEFEACSIIVALCRLPASVCEGEPNPRTEYVSNDLSYCTVRLKFVDFSKSMVHHYFHVVYPERRDSNSRKCCLRHCTERYNADLLVHVGTAVSQDDSVRIGDVILPSEINGKRISKCLPAEGSCVSLLSANVFQALTECVSTWCPSGALSVRLLSSAATFMSQRQTEGTSGTVGEGWDVEALSALQRSGLARVRLVEGEDNGMVAFELNEEVQRKVTSLVRSQRPPSSLCVSSAEDVLLLERPLSVSGEEGDLFLSKEDNRCLCNLLECSDQARLISVNCVGSLFARLQDGSSNRSSKELATTVAVDIVMSEIAKDRHCYSERMYQ